MAHQPKYRRVADDLMRKIETGELRPSAKLPSDLELMEEYGETRTAVREAISWLAVRQLVERKPGQGTYVTRRITPIVTTLSQVPETGRAGGDAVGAFDEYMAFLERQTAPFDAGRDESHLLPKPHKSTPSVETVRAPDFVAERLLVTPGDAVVRRHQEFRVDHNAWSIQTTYYPMSLIDRGAKDLLRASDFKEGELAYITASVGLERCGYRVRILFRKATKDEAGFFDLPKDDSVHVVSLIRTAYEDRPDHGPYPFRVNFSVFPGDRHQFVMNHGEYPDEPAAPARDH